MNMKQIAAEIEHNRARLNMIDCSNFADEEKRKAQMAEINRNLNKLCSEFKNMIGDTK